MSTQPLVLGPNNFICPFLVDLLLMAFLKFHFLHNFSGKIRQFDHFFSHLMLFAYMIYVSPQCCCIQQTICLTYFMSNYLMCENCISPKWLYISLSLGFHQILSTKGMRLRRKGQGEQGFLSHIFNTLLGKTGNADVQKSLRPCPDLYNTKIISECSYTEVG